MGAPNTLKFQCKCGTVTGTIEQATPAEGDYVVCHCSDCQAVPRHLGAAERILDEHGGTALYQSRCARLKIASGKDRLAGLHMTDKPTLRWYATCCDTPMFNTYATGKLPYVTTLLANCDAEGRAALGEPVGHLFLDDAPGDTSGLKPLSMNALLRRFFKRLIKDLFSGDRRRNPLFDSKTLEPIAVPRRLTPAERQAAGGT
ncbi:DUF6151 family protein [Qipengyuania sphaerica]|uniref:DUF6151 family protein n=1 Tax=Qipengyuania sphaerica TaxID=2867243 RepID=UPI001C87C0D9|nr:DUF6151 family protein [Qipengyuania sphaerica]MBX7540398.1 hypothetical protein [Qipengyuania sphaerica]